MVRFGLAGLLATGVYFLLVNGFVLLWNVDAVKASVYAYLPALVFSYAVQSRFTFRAADDCRSQIIRFVMASLLGLGIAYGGMALCRDVLDLPYQAGAVAICVLVPLVSFIVFKHWVFVRKSRTAERFEFAGD